MCGILHSQVTSERLVSKSRFQYISMMLLFVGVVLFVCQTSLSNSNFQVSCLPYHHHDHHHQNNSSNLVDELLVNNNRSAAATISSTHSSFTDRKLPLANSQRLNNNNNNGIGQGGDVRKTRAVYLAHQDDSHNNMKFSGNIQNSNNNSQSSKFFLPPILDQCCACDEAKYELVFEGLWSRYTHPDDFPENYELAHFSDIIGASHSNEFRMWNDNTLATEGVKELAETGSTKKLESELKQVSSKTRTIIKARELRYPTLYGKTSAVFRTDRQHHLVSMLSKLGPSPDWMVGVSGLELCQSDCSWASQRVVNLYLWDAGTDSGTTFTSPDTPTYPQGKIHPFKKVFRDSWDSSAPIMTTTQRSSFDLLQDYNMNYESPSTNYHRSSFDSLDEQSGSGSGSSSSSSSSPSSPSSSSPSNPTIQIPQSSLPYITDQSKPFARLTITRQRVYEKSCNGETVSPLMRHTQTTPINPDSWLEPTRPTYSDCRFTDWSDWSTCSSNCGKGIRTRTRSFIDEQAHLAGCSQIDLIEKEICLSECIGNTFCVTRDWSDWSKCSVNCGQGYRKRTRSPIGQMRRACESVELAEIEPCTGTQGASNNNCTQEPSTCELTDWSQWSDCSVACGKGTRIRTRQYIKKESIENCSARLIQKQSCNGRPELCRQHSNPKGQSQSQQTVETMSEKLNPNLPVIDCKMSAWSPWSTCSALCGNGKRTRSRYIIQMPQNGGKPCDKKLSRNQKCKDLPPCPPNFIITATNNNNNNSSSSSSSSSNNLQHSSQFSSTDYPRSQTFNSNNNKGFGRQGSNGGGGFTGRSNISLIWRTTTPASTGGSMMDDDDDSKFSRLLQSESGHHLHQTSFTSNESIVGDANPQQPILTEMRLIGSTSFNIKDGSVYPLQD